MFEDDWPSLITLTCGRDQSEICLDARLVVAVLSGSDKTKTTMVFFETSSGLVTVPVMETPGEVHRRIQVAKAKSDGYGHDMREQGSWLQ